MQYSTGYHVQDTLLNIWKCSYVNPPTVLQFEYHISCSRCHVIVMNTTASTAVLVTSYWSLHHVTSTGHYYHTSRTTHTEVPCSPTALCGTDRNQLSRCKTNSITSWLDSEHDCDWFYWFPRSVSILCFFVISTSDFVFPQKTASNSRQWRVERSDTWCIMQPPLFLLILYWQHLPFGNQSIFLYVFPRRSIPDVQSIAIIVFLSFNSGSWWYAIRPCPSTSLYTE